MVVVVVLAAVAALGTVAARWWCSDPPRRWVDGSVHGDWIAVFDGQGQTVSDGSTTTLDPKAATEPGETHAGLVVSTAVYGDVDLSARVRTVAQSRTGSPPNPWEVGWLVWHLREADLRPGVRTGAVTSTRFYYFAVKPNGWELGKVDPAEPGGQRFLATGPRPADAGRAHDVRVRQLGATIDVWVDTAPVVTFTDDDPQLRGAVGLYSEDARVEFSRVRIRPADLS
ncbi:family 16 glycoside hydrolase [Kineococcus sp. LSe6-4]|uniref:Family 16 glycoside hydrolase n=1 Tax=Kineococcus halophytocola TaxID=3234027 RepID=A0ABV4GZM0_9ACTN